MTNSTTAIALREAFDEAEPSLPGDASVKKLRRDGIARFAALGFPTTALEAWRRTDVSALARTSFAVADSPGILPSKAEIEKRVPEPKSPRLVFVDGHFVPSLSATNGGPAHVANLAGLLRDDSAALASALGRDTANGTAFAALNTAFFRDGAFVHVPDRVVLREPIQILHVATRRSAPHAVHARTLVVAGAESEAAVVESYTGPAGAVYLTNAVTEVVAGDAAVVDHSKVQEEGDRAYHVATTHFAQGRDATVRSLSVAFGGALSREDVGVRFDGEGGEAVVNGLFALDGSQHYDAHTRIDHAQPHCASREVFKGILDGKSRGVFDGRIIVRPGAQKTDAKQTNKNLLLSREALVDSNPTLEIYADDVKCTHGSTTGQLDEDQMFYLRSRGIGTHEARSILTMAFARDLVEHVKLEALRERLDATLARRLRSGRSPTPEDAA